MNLKLDYLLIITVIKMPYCLYFTFMRKWILIHNIVQISHCYPVGLFLFIWKFLIHSYLHIKNSFIGYNDGIMKVQKSGWTWDFVEIAKKSHSCVMLRRLGSRRLLLCYRLGDPFGYFFEVISGNAQHKAVKSHTVLKSYGKIFRRLCP